MNSRHKSSIIQALLAAALFGVSAPLAKLLLGEVEPIPLAAFLYLGSGIGLLFVKIFQRFSQQGQDSESQINKHDLLWLAGAIIAGGIAAPITLLYSLRNTPAATASLLLSFEGAATTLIAFFIFKESISRYAWRAIALITLGSILLSVNFSAEWGFSTGAVGIIAACFFWGIDNNLTRNISAKDPLIIVTIKGLAAGSFSLFLAFLFGNHFPAWDVIAGALVLGSISYGASIVLFIHAMRGIGAARTSMLFSSAPISGMILSFILFREIPGWMMMAAFPLMAAGTLLLTRENHEHEHVHEMTIHDHAHEHTDGHHEHAHDGINEQKHTHIHEHETMIHEHHHMPDLQHRHTHSSDT